MLSDVRWNNRAAVREVYKPVMEDAKDRGDRLVPSGEKSALQGQLDTQAARNAGAADLKAAEATRTNQSSGSLTELALKSRGMTREQVSAQLKAQGDSVSIDYGNGLEASRKSGLTEKDLQQTGQSRTEKVSEKELLAQAAKEALIEQSRTMQELETAAKTDPVAEVLLGFRRQAEAMKPGPDKERLTKLAKEQAAELLAPRAIDDQESCAVHDVPNGLSKLLSGHVQYPDKAVEGLRRLSPEDLSKLAKAFEMAGPAAEASIKETSGEILRRTGESYKDTVLCGINAAVGLLEYDRDLLFNPEKAREKAAGAGEVLGLLMYHGAVFSIKTGAYAETVRQSGDYSLPLKHIPQVLNSWYERQSPADQMAIIASVTGGLHLNQSIGEMQKLRQPGAFTGFLQEAVDLLPRNPEAERRAMEVLGGLVKRAEPVAEKAAAAGGKISDVVQEVQEKGIKEHIMEMREYFPEGKKHRKGVTEIAKEQGISVKEVHQMTDAQLELLRLERIEEGYRTAFYKEYPHLKNKGLEVHHALPQALLDKCPGMFKAKEIHSLKYLSGIPKVAINGEDVHDIITASWNKFLRQNENPTREQVIAHMRKLDEEYGRYFVPPLGRGAR